jgi:nitric oxide synthase oxygenase domain/subunit
MIAHLQERAEQIACSAALRVTDECGVGKEATLALAKAFMKIATEALVSLEMDEADIIDEFTLAYHSTCFEDRETADLPMNDQVSTRAEVLRVVR